MLLSLLLNGRVDDLPPIPREFRAVWVATVDNIDWPSKPGLSSSLQRAEMIRILDRAAAMKLNAIVFQVRPAADALYRSKLEPWSEYLTGKQGKDPGYDPLEFTVEQAHRRGLEVHCWFNPYRAKHPTAKGQLARNHIAKTNPSVVKPYGKLLWMDPGEPIVQKRSRDVFLDVVRRYDVDGIHMDDYFYPYPENDAPFPDGNSFRKYGHGLSLGDWRRKNVDDFVKDVYVRIHKIKPWVQFGISPFGVYRPGLPAGTTAGIDQYATLYADPLKWLRSGWLDYIAPQLYWATAQKLQSFPVLLDWWRNENPQGRHIWPGLYTSRLLPGEPKGGYTPDEIIRQINFTRTDPDAGHIHFSMKALTEDAKGVSDRLQGSVYTADALPPASPWLGANAPKPPTTHVDAPGILTWEADDAFKFVLWTRHGSNWQVRVLPGAANTMDENVRAALGPLEQAAIASVGRTGNVSEPVRFELK